MNQLNKTIILWSPECLCLRSFTTPWKECVIHESGTVLAQASSTFKRASQPRRDEIIWNSWDGCCQWFNRNPRPILQECKQGISTADAHGVFCGECLRHPAIQVFLSSPIVYPLHSRKVKFPSCICTSADTASEMWNDWRITAHLHSVPRAETT